MDTNNTQTHETGFERRMVRSRSRNAKRWEEEPRREESVGFRRNPCCKGRDRDAKCEIRAVFLRASKGGTEREATEVGGRGRGVYDDVDGGLKGNERGMMQAWVRIVAKAGGWSLPTNRGKKGTKE